MTKREADELERHPLSEREYGRLLNNVRFWG